MIFPKSWHNHTKHIKGQAMVEMAFVLFVLVLLAFGITEFGRAMYTKNTLNNAARAGARQAVVTPGITNATKSDLTTAFSCSTTPNDCMYQAVSGSLFNGINKSQVSVTLAGGTGSGNKAITGDNITVTVTYGTAGSPNTGFRSVVPNLIPIRNVLTGQASMRFE